MSVVEVQPGLWISGIKGIDQIAYTGITHVVSVINWEPDSTHINKLSNCTNLHIDLEDAAEADLLRHLPTATNFVTTALSTNNNNKVLVHCNQGVSRSAAIITAYIMKTQNLDVTAAINLIKSSYPAASPNSGFLQQLTLFHTMRCTLDQSCISYKKHVLEQAGRHYELTGTLDASTLNQPTDDGSCKVKLYRCRKCRSLVATADNVVEVEMGAGQAAFQWRKRDKHSTGAGSTGGGSSSNNEYYKNNDTSNNPNPASSPTSVSREEDSLFVEPLLWMQHMVQAAIQGKLYCPLEKCNSRLGSFNWSGIQTSSGSWVTPAFQLHVSKLDTVDVKTAMPSGSVSGIRQPKLLGGGGGVGNISSAAGITTAVEKLTLSSGGGNGTTTNKTTPPPATTQGDQQPKQGYFTHLVLDCDGVLVDSEVASCHSLYLSIKQVTGFEIPHNFPIDYTPVFGMDVTSCVRYYKETYAMEEWGDVDVLGAQVTQVKEEIYKELTAKGVTAFLGVPQLLQQAQSLNMGIAVASSGAPEKIKHNLGTSGLIDLFDPYLVVSATYVKRGKPAPDVYIEALRRLGCADPSRAVVVEDAVNGMKAGREAGCFIVAVTTSLPAEIVAPWADVVVGSIGDVDLMALKPPVGSLVSEK